MKQNYYLDPSKITKFNCTHPELELRVLFWVCAAGKNGTTAAKCLGDLLSSRAEFVSSYTEPTPFNIIKRLNFASNLPEELRKFGIGCYRNKARSFIQLAFSGLNLATCSLEELERIHGIGPKTARCFLIHSRENQNYAGLDTHILKFLRELGHNTPKSTPTGKRYKDLETVFLKLVKKSKLTVAEADLNIWNVYSGKGGNKQDLFEIFKS